MTKSLLVLGCGGHGRVVADTALACGFERIAFLDDAYEKLQSGLPFPVLGPLKMVSELVREWPMAITAVGDNTRRQELFRVLGDEGYEMPAIVHPSALLSPAAQVANGVFVAPGAIVNTGTRISEAAIVNTGARIDHDCLIGAVCHIAPGVTLSGGVIIGERAWLGTGCAVRQGVRIESDVIVGVGAAVVADLAVADTYVGVPARPLRKQR